METIKELENLILDNTEMFYFAFNDKNVIEILFYDGINKYLSYDEEKLKRIIYKRVMEYFENQFENKKLPVLFNKYIEYYKKETIDATDFVLFDELLSKIDYELSFDDVSKITSNKKVSEYLNQKISKEIIEANDFLEQLYGFVNIEDDEKLKEIDINAIADDNVKLYKNDCRAYGLLNYEEERMYAIKYRNTKDEEAKEMLICCNQRLVWREANRYLNRGLELLDLIDEGNIGLMKAIDRFDPDLGYKLSTYITWWIRQTIRRAVYEKGRTIRIPVHLSERFNKLSKIENMLIQKLEREPTDIEILNLWNELTNGKNKMTLDRIKEIRGYKEKADLISLNKIEGENEESELADFIADEEASDPVKYSEEIEIRLVINRVLDELDNFKTEEGSKRAAQMVRMYEGIFNEETVKILVNAGKNAFPRNMTLNEIAEIYGISGERVRQIIEKAKRGMKQHIISYEREDLVEKVKKKKSNH